MGVLGFGRGPSVIVRPHGTDDADLLNEAQFAPNRSRLMTETIARILVTPGFQC